MELQKLQKFIYDFNLIYMFRLFSSRNPVFRFSTKAFDVAVIGAGPGGIL